MTDIDVILADGQPLSLLGMRSAVADQGDIRILAECLNPRCLAQAIRLRPPDVLLISASLLGDELGPLKQLVSQNHKTRVIVITTHTDAGFLDSAIRCGAKGVIQGESPLEEIPAAIRKVTSGGVWSERVAA